MIRQKQHSDPWEGWRNPESYFSGIRTTYPCPVDNLLGFIRRTGRDLVSESDVEHHHHRWIWVLARSGTAVNVVKGTPFPLNSGEMLLIPGDTPHYHQAEPDTLLDWCFLTFESGVMNWKKELGERVITPEPADRALFQTVIQHVRQKEANEAALTLSLFHERLMTYHATRSSPQDRWLSRIQEWALGTEEPGTITALADHLGGSESHLRHQFREHTGLSLGRYLLHLRMVRAGEWLRDPEMPVTDIAYRSGYGSPGNFSRAFLREMGLTPRNFRKRMMTTKPYNKIDG